MKEEAKPAEPKKAEPKPKATKEDKPEPKKAEAKEKKAVEGYDCDDLIEKAKERKAKAKAAAEKRANQPKKTPATKNKEAVRGAAERVEKNVEKRVEKGEVKVAEIEKIILEYEEAIRKLKALLKKAKTTTKFKVGGSVNSDELEAILKDAHSVKDSHCKCNDKMAKGGLLKDKANYIPNRMISTLEVERNGRITDIDPADIIDGVYVKKRVKYADGGGVEDGDFGAEKAGERKSRKYSTVEIKSGGEYTRRNANQYGKAKGGRNYTENRDNRSDKRRWK